MFVFLFTEKRAKKEYYKDLDLHVVLTQKRFGKTIKIVSGNKVKTCNTISLIKKSIVITLEKALATKPFMSFFLTLFQILGIDVYDMYRYLNA